MPIPPDSPSVLLFDVNETLLDLAPVKRLVNDVLLDEDGATLWFSTMLHHSLVMTVSGRHADLFEIGAAVLQMLVRNRDASIELEEARQTLSAMRNLMPYPDVVSSLARLKRSGYRLATLSNSSSAGVSQQLQHAGLAEFFERQMSVETPQVFKPHRAVYEWAAAQMGADAADCMLVAAHGWDVAGAKWAGMRAAFIARERQQRFPLAEPPEIDVADLVALADALGA